MKFGNKLEYANHINRFCADSEYADPDKLLKQLKFEQQESRNPQHLSFGEVKNYLKAQNDGEQNIGKKVGDMHLDELRSKFSTQGLDQDLEQLKSEIIKRREKELISQLRELKHREKKLLVSRRKNEKHLADKMEIFNKDKEQEMKARLERERIKGILYVLYVGLCAYIQMPLLL